MDGMINPIVRVRSLFRDRAASFGSNPKIFNDLANVREHFRSNIVATVNDTGHRSASNTCRLRDISQIGTTAFRSHN